VIVFVSPFSLIQLLISVYLSRSTLLLPGLVVVVIAKEITRVLDCWVRTNLV
jgi:hypothetical protein